ncbi:MAG: guanylate kinase [Bryobacterales bacterium]|nr:guanylate kinase [Bryobacteraceae bacterium]MDW8130431.1 guanylate kinase [Bryobacterales bacterium]
MKEGAGQRAPIVYIVSGPSGSGKSTLVREVLKTVPGLLFSVSYTTREPRGAERDGEHYHFIGREAFEERIRRGEFLEWAVVFGQYYGTHRSYLDRAATEGRDLVLDIDVQGARQLKGSVPDAVSVFVLVPSPEELERRLRRRSEDAEEAIRRRLGEAARELAAYGAYDYLLVNDELERAAQRLAAIIEAERLKRTRMEPLARAILARFEARTGAEAEALEGGEQDPDGQPHHSR